MSAVLFVPAEHGLIEWLQCVGSVKSHDYVFLRKLEDLDGKMRLVIVDDEPKALLSGAANITREFNEVVGCHPS